MTRASAAQAGLCSDEKPLARPTFTSDSRRPQRVAAKLGQAPTPTAALMISAAIFVALFAMTFHHVLLERRLALETAAQAVDARASALAARLDEALSASPQLAPGDVLRRILAAHPELRSADLLIADRDGRVIASDPPRDPTDATLETLLGAAQPLAVLAENAGAMRVETTNGGDAFAAVRNLNYGSGQIAIFAPVAELLAPWRRMAVAMFTLVGATSVLLAGFTALLVANNRRKRAQLRDERAFRAHVDLALNRGRCGLWNWNLATGEVAWSTSMFEILGLTPTERLWSIAELHEFVHPEDRRLQDIAAAALERRGASGRFRIPDARRRRRLGLASQTRRNRPRPDDGRADADRHRARRQRSQARGRGFGDRGPAIAGGDRSDLGGVCSVGRGQSARRLQHQVSKAARLDRRGHPARRALRGSGGVEPAPFSKPPDGRSSPATQASERRGSGTYEVNLADGRWLQVNERRTRDGGYVSVGTDITALKEHEEQLRQIRAAAAWRPSPSCASRGDRSNCRRSNSPIWPNAITSRRRRPKWPIAPRRSSSPI